MSIQIYGQAGCGQCEQAKAKLFREQKKLNDLSQDSSKFNYEYLQIAEHKEALTEKFETLPRSLPIIIYNDTMYNFTQLDGLIKEIKEL